jgi:hypothetical protein
MAITPNAASTDTIHVGSWPGFTTYQLRFALSAMEVSCYTAFGNHDHPLHLPAAFQVPAPFGQNVGGTNPKFWAIKPAAKFDSWLTAGETAGNTKHQVSSIGINFDFWTETSPLSVTDGAVFWMSPDDAPHAAECVLAQLTLPTSLGGWHAVINVQGRTSAGAGQDWQALGVRFGPPRPPQSPPPPPLPPPTMAVDARLSPLVVNAVYVTAPVAAQLQVRGSPTAVAAGQRGFSVGAPPVRVLAVGALLEPGMAHLQRGAERQMGRATAAGGARGDRGAAASAVGPGVRRRNQGAGAGGAGRRFRLAGVLRLPSRFALYNCLLWRVFMGAAVA